MRIATAAWGLAASLLTAAGASAQTVDSALYVVRLGVDTVALERWVSSPDSLHVVAVSRSPRTAVRRYSVRLNAHGRVTHAAVGTSLAHEPVADGAIPVAGGMFAPYGLAVSYARRSGSAEAQVPMRIGSGTRTVPVQRRSAGEYSLPNQFDAMLLVRVDADGGVTHIDAGGGSTVERVAPFDLEALTREFAARDEHGTGLGMLSPRDTARGTVDGVDITIDYSRPSARGRTVMGALVPYDAVWRTGANNASELVTEAAIDIGGVRLEAGRYSLFTIPGRDSWQLMINREVGISGLDHDPVQDIGRTTLRAAPSATHTEQFTISVGDGRLRIRWGNADVSVPVRRGS